MFNVVMYHTLGTSSLIWFKKNNNNVDGLNRKRKERKILSERHSYDHSSVLEERLNSKYQSQTKGVTHAGVSIKE
jgi:hypothetical protein